MRISAPKLASVGPSVVALCGLLSVHSASAALAAEAGDLEVAPLQVAREIETGAALADYWVAQPVEYRVTAEAVLDAVGASTLSRDSVGASALADFLVWFGGGGGAPQDLIKLRPLESATVQRQTVVK